jgi:hypothetical protein
MRHARVYIFLFLLLLCVAAVAFVAMFWYQQKERMAREDEEMRFDRASVTGIKGRVVTDDHLLPIEPDYVDLSSYADLLVALFQPSDRSPYEKRKYPQLCELVIERKEAPPLTISVIMFGMKGHVYYANHSRFCYSRGAPIYPVNKRKGNYISEAGCICELIKALAKKDDARAQKIEHLLRQSVGFEESPE